MNTNIIDVPKRFRCDVCGRYISLKDIATDVASIRMITPDSECTVEDYETLCKQHYDY